MHIAYLKCKYKHICNECNTSLITLLQLLTLEL
jgi:hypothetical protein